jgi:hypothetical protein
MGICLCICFTDLIRLVDLFANIIPFSSHTLTAEATFLRSHGVIQEVECFSSMEKVKNNIENMDSFCWK